MLGLCFLTHPCLFAFFLGIKDMSKEAGERWRAMSSEDKVPFEMKAKNAKVS